MMAVDTTTAPSDAESSDGQSPILTRKGKKAKVADVADATTMGDEGLGEPQHSAVYRCCQPKGPETLDDAITALKTLGFKADPVPQTSANFASFLRLSHNTECPRTLNPTDKTLLVRDDTFGCPASFIGVVEGVSPTTGLSMWHICAELTGFLSQEVLRESEPSILVRPKTVTKTSPNGDTVRTNVFSIWSTKPNRASRLMMLCGKLQDKRTKAVFDRGTVTCVPVHEGITAACARTEQKRMDRRQFASDRYGRRIVIFLKELDSTCLQPGPARIQLKDALHEALGGETNVEAVDILPSRAGNLVAFATLKSEDLAAQALETGVGLGHSILRCQLARPPPSIETRPVNEPDDVHRARNTMHKTTAHPTARSYAEAAGRQGPKQTAGSNLQEEQLFSRLEKRLLASLESKFEAMAAAIIEQVETRLRNFVDEVSARLTSLLSPLSNTARASPTRAVNPRASSAPANTSMDINEFRDLMRALVDYRAATQKSDIATTNARHDSDSDL